MKLLAITIIAVALYLIYRIAFPKQVNIKKENAIPQKEETDAGNVVGQSRFVRVSRSQSKTNDAIIEEPGNQLEKDFTFAHKIENKEAIIPLENLDEVFGGASEFDENELEIDDEDYEDNEPDLEEETESIQGIIGEDVAYAGGFTFDEMAEAIASENNPELLYNLSKTDMFEQLVSSDADKNARISAILEKYEKSLAGEEQENSDNEYSNFNIADYLS